MWSFRAPVIPVKMDLKSSCLPGKHRHSGRPCTPPASHLPGFVVKADELKAKGVDTIACLSVNDAFVMGAWGEQQNADALLMLADGDAEFTKAMGLELDLTGKQFGLRSQRYAMIVEDGVVKVLNVEAPGKMEVSSAEAMLAAL